MKIGVLAALWAAVIGAVLVTRFRRQLGAERSRIEQLQQLHKVELERELATHREQELILEQNYLDSLDAEQDDMISQLRAEIVALRVQLSELLGEDFDDEQVALRAQAERLREIDAPVASPLKDPKGNHRPEPRAAAHRNELRANGNVGEHTLHGGGQPEGDNDTETKQVPPAAEATPEPHGAHRAVEPDTSQPPVEVDEVDKDHRDPNFDTSSFKAVHWEETPRDNNTGAHASGATGFGDTEVNDEPTRQLQAIGDDIDEEQPTSRHGRRRAEENSKGLTVAEIMAQMRKNK